MFRTIVLAAVVALCFAATAAAVPAAHVKVDVCHATGSESNPYVLVNVNVNSVGVANDLNGHAGHTDDAWASFEYDGVTYPGQGDMGNCTDVPPPPEPTCEDDPTLCPVDPPDDPPCSERGDSLNGIPVCTPDDGTPRDPQDGGTSSTPPFEGGTTGGDPVRASNSLPFTGLPLWVAVPLGVLLLVFGVLLYALARMAGRDEEPWRDLDDLS